MAEQASRRATASRPHIVPIGSLPLDSPFWGLLEFVPDAVVVVDATGDIRLLNSQAERLFGFARDELMGRSVEVLVPGRFRGAHVDHRGGYLDQPRTRPMGAGLELFGLRRDGTEFPVEISLSPVETESGLLVLAAIRDVTDRVQAEEERRELEAEQRARKRAEGLVTRLQNIQAVTDAALSDLDLDELLRALLSRIRAALSADVAMVLLVSDEGSVLEARALEGGNGDAVVADQVPIGEGVAGRIAQTGQPEIVEDISQEEVVSDFIRSHLRSLIGVPLVAAGRTIGVLQLGTKERRAFGEQERELLELVAQRAASAIERARLADEIRRHAASLEERVEERTAQLVESNAELETFAYSVSHDLRAPLRAMHGLAQALSEDYGHQLDETGRRYAEGIFSAAKRLDELISDLLAYSRLGTTEIDLIPTELEGVVREAITRCGPALEGADLTVEAPLHRVLSHPPVLVQVVTNLLENAAKFVAPGETPRIRVRSEEVEGRARLWVEDEGIGIAPDHLDRIFRVFERLHTLEEYAGTGIGLALVRKAVGRMEGSVGVASEPGAGSRFWIELPSAGDDDE